MYDDANDKVIERVPPDINQNLANPTKGIH